MRTSLHRKRPAPDLRLRELTADLAYRQCDMADDPELVESCIYQIKALKARYNYLLRLVKSHGSGAQAAGGIKGERRWI